ncbi:TPA: hypothetical protein ACHC9S_001409 [Streptococcus pyogenes]|nr:hypothetical protein [Streptococcus pyogenes]HER4687733.1 hypothetical protein [Streptococcus pyogenes NGAS364]HER4777576.1 hypothetical protein [Streptococcus pyogenes NGAS169]ESU92159.1 bacteriocin-type signal sequence [Streptococcus pyogenes GA19702]SQF08550.1 Uncharacterised protein [Streptococcus pyogenes]SQG23587.1 Uncharacterised protein [Streptococcus pyogenes]
MKKLTNSQSIFNQQSLIPTNELKQIIGGDIFSFFDNLFPSKKIIKNG